jgi:hypothetical protein
VRRAESYARRGPKREPYDSVLIVCEGGKSEPNYLGRLREIHRLSMANIRITPADGTDPMSVVAFAEKECARIEYDRVFCVFDRDEHANYHAAVTRAANLPRFSAITSWPCFEVWILLHFIYSAAPRDRGALYNEVRRHYPGYTKGCKTVYDDLASQLEWALRHGRQLTSENSRSGSLNPATKMHDLVQYLIGLKS